MFIEGRWPQWGEIKSNKGKSQVGHVAIVFGILIRKAAAFDRQVTDKEIAIFFVLINCKFNWKLASQPAGWGWLTEGLSGSSA